MSAQTEVRKASNRFYAALNRMANGDAGSLADVWSHGEDVTTLHPIGGRQVGWEEVRESFENVAELVADGRIDLEDQLIRVAGDLAYELGVEKGSFTLSGQKIDIEQRVTNIYRLEDGEWKMIHHHTDTSRAMLDVLGKLETPGTAGRRI